MPYIEGLEGLRVALSEDAANRQSFGAFLTLRAGESARIRFITDGPGVVTALYHSVSEVSKAGRPFYKNVYCGWEDGDECRYCQDVQRGEPIRSKKMNMYVWVYAVTRVDGSQEVVSEPRVLRSGVGKNNYLVATLSNYLKKYSTLTDRDYEWKRDGATQDDTVYSLLPEDKGPAPQSISEVTSKLPPLGDIARDDFTKWTFAKKQSAPASPREGTTPAKGQEMTIGPRTGSLLQRLRARTAAPVEEAPGEEIGEAL